MKNDTAECTQVFLAKDSDAIRMRLAAMLGKLANVSSVGEARTPALAIEGILRTQPHLAILDIQLAEGSGMDMPAHNQSDGNRDRVHYAHQSLSPAIPQCLPERRGHPFSGQGE